MKKFLHVAFNTKNPRISDWELVFDNASDWLRYAPNCWILYTNRTPQQWFNLIQPSLQQDERVLICELNITRKQGWLPKDTWSWLNKRR